MDDYNIDWSNDATGNLDWNTPSDPTSMLDWNTPSNPTATLPNYSQFDQPLEQGTTDYGILGQNMFGQGLQPSSGTSAILSDVNGGNVSSQGFPANVGGGISNVLSQIFSNKGLMTGLGALFEGSQNKKNAANTRQIVAQQQAQQNPFGDQRAYYQQQLQNTVQNPYSQPIVQAQVQELQRAQAIKDAAAGRRSNSATSSPALAAAQAQIAQNYMNSLMTPAGANISPSGLQGLSQLVQANNQSTNGYISPLMSALGYNTQANRTNQGNNQALTEAIQKFLSGGE